MSEQEPLYPSSTKELAEQRKRLAPQTAEAFQAFSRSVFAEGALSAKTKQLIALAHDPRRAFNVTLPAIRLTVRRMRGYRRISRRSTAG